MPERKTDRTRMNTELEQVKQSRGEIYAIGVRNAQERDAAWAEVERLRASVQELRRVTAIATAWLTPGNYPPTEVDGISIPEVDMDRREVVVMLRAALRDTGSVD